LIAAFFLFTTPNRAQRKESGDESPHCKGGRSLNGPRCRQIAALPETLAAHPELLPLVSPAFARYDITFRLFPFPESPRPCP
jgi:hypothetical protein